MGKTKIVSDHSKPKINLKQKQLKIIHPQIALSQANSFMRFYHIYLKQNMALEKNEFLLQQEPESISFAKQLIKRAIKKDKMTLIKIEPERDRFFDVYYDLSTSEDRQKCLSIISHLVQTICTNS